MPTSRNPKIAHSNAKPNKESLAKQSLNDEFHHLREVVQKCGSVTAASRELGMPRTTLRERLEKLAGEPPTYEGFKPRAVSTMVPNAFGKPEWVKMERRPTTPADIEQAFQGLDIPRAKPVRAPKERRPGLSLYGIGDPHIGQLSWHRECGENWNTQMNVSVHLEAFRGLLARAEGGTDALIALMGDNTHANDNNAQTPRSKHSLDVDSRIGKVGWELVTMANTMIQEALAVHQHVTLVILAGNHDPEVAQLLSMAFRLRYQDEPRVAILHNSAALLKFTYGENLFGFLHGHTMKPADAPTVMAHDWYEDWGRCRNKYVFAGHFHHSRRGKIRILRDDTEGLNEGCHIEIFPTLTAKDAYAAGSKFRATRAMTRIDFCPVRGEIARYLYKPTPTPDGKRLEEATKNTKPTKPTKRTKAPPKKISKRRR